ncbi:DUF1993 family protein [Duganella violaceipulchra]|uniref:DUF1993 domain-containing protein n=1 Tax=Duganella violaceipulchra TaxID=2849652 RepID=A0AA41H4Z9_9BURK|nr:DUF1993 domain-containing protein [Duganella violaceicalia]MBV6321723.1 DUF1993 domain-containing protein [Duganella violaceicalia]MCP2011195.1 hypothetical protein [Duganella violaceicalia]
MSLSMHQVSVPVFVRGLKVLSDLLGKAEAYVEQHGSVPDAMISARLADDMLPLSAQVQRASDTSKLSVERLSGVAAPKIEDNETSFAQLQQRITDTITYLNSVAESDFAGSEARAIKLNFGAFQPEFKGDDYLLTFALPNFFFHIATAHDILRNQGVPVGKRDYLGPFA